MAKELVFQRHQTGCLKISAEVAEQMLLFMQDTENRPEAGGVLLGRHLLEGNHIIVDRISVPTPEDRRSRYRFFREREQHQAIIDQAWNDSNGTCTYLGEWHTHPEAVPSPSQIDLDTWRQKLRTDQFTSYLFFVILGMNEVCAWEGFRRRPKLFQLDLGVGPGL